MLSAIGGFLTDESSLINLMGKVEADVAHRQLKHAAGMAKQLSTERWHPKQKGKFHEDGSYELELPYSKDTELMMDILRYGANIKVLAPTDLVTRVKNETVAMTAIYS